MQTIEYSGKDTLLVLREAKTYQAHLLGLLKQELTPESMLLEVGSGLGDMAQDLKGRGHHVDCIETDQGMAADLAKRGFAVYPSLKSLNSSKAYDCIFSYNVLEHIEDDAEVLKECHSLLRPSGKLVIFVPALMSLYTSLDRKVGHFRRYEPKSFANLVRQTGFEIERLDFVDSLGYLAAKLYKLIGSEEGEITKGQVRVYDSLVFPLSKTLDKAFRRWFGKNLFLVAKPK